MELLPGMSRVRLQISGLTRWRFAARDDEPVLDVGVAWPDVVSRRRVARALALLPAGSFATAHVPHTVDFADVLRDLDLRMVLMIRDPRDVAVSSAEYLSMQRNHALHPHFAGRSRRDRILDSIVGVAPDGPGSGLRNIAQRVESVVRWESEPFVHVTRFEDLVGPGGGGDRGRQLREIRGIAGHLGINCSDSEVATIAGGVFGGTDTFRSGQIGAWRRHLDDQHVEVAKPLLDQLLVRLGYESGSDWA
ncbi:MAG: sulfotransferase domain-containing protein [Actinomycetota bacterium]|nr:sulfotransferase domain-containing protein [Actinomycetota bacterium]